MAPSNVPMIFHEVPATRLTDLVTRMGGSDLSSLPRARRKRAPGENVADQRPGKSIRHRCVAVQLFAAVVEQRIESERLSAQPARAGGRGVGDAAHQRVQRGGVVAVVLLGLRFDSVAAARDGLILAQPHAQAHQGRIRLGSVRTRQARASSATGLVASMTLMTDPWVWGAGAAVRPPGSRSRPAPADR